MKNISEGPLNNMSSLIQIMTWRQTSDKPLSEPMKDYLATMQLRYWRKTTTISDEGNSPVAPFTNMV